MAVGGGHHDWHVVCDVVGGMLVGEPMTAKKLGRPRGPATERFSIAVPVEVAAEIREIAEDLDRSLTWVLTQTVLQGLEHVAQGWVIR